MVRFTGTPIVVHGPFAPSFLGSYAHLCRPPHAGKTSHCAKTRHNNNWAGICMYGVPQKCHGPHDLRLTGPFDQRFKNHWSQYHMHASNGHFCQVKGRAHHASTSRVFRLLWLHLKLVCMHQVTQRHGTLSSRKSTRIRKHSGPGLMGSIELGAK